jgi:thiamine-phosphate diphosphorylase
VRDRGASARAVYARVREVKERVRGRAWVVVNDRVDVAVAAEADGVQLGGWSLPIEDARRVAVQLRFGVSVHSAIEAESAANDGGADWVVLGSIYPTSSHPGGATVGPEAIGTAARGAGAPIIAIGGITPENVDEVLQFGAHGVAVISAIVGAPSPRAAAARFRGAIDTRYPAWS